MSRAQMCATYHWLRKRQEEREKILKEIKKAVDLPKN